MSHEIRTPMNAILGMAYLVRRSGITPEQADRLDKIDTAAQHLLNIINDVLDLAKVEAGKFILAAIPVAIDSLLININSIMGSRAQEKGLVFHIESDAFPIPLQGDPTRIQQAILNYVANAVKFTEHGTVTLRAIKQDETPGDVCIRFEVTDTGIGIPPDALPRLFRAFEQADNSATRHYGGSGLGLVITRRLAELMGGEAGVETSPVGSTFWFTARLKKIERRSDFPKRNAINAEKTIRERYQGQRILLVDDDPTNLEVACSLLKEAGLIIDTAEDGIEAVELARVERYAIVLMDMQMPKLDGLGATQQIREIPGYRRIPILAVSANAFIEDRDRCLAIGMNDFLTKPFTPEELFSILLKHLEQQSNLSVSGQS